MKKASPVQSINFLCDQETKVDLLNNEAMARIIVRLIKETHGRPMTIGVHGDWGAGKSSILEMIDEAFSTDSSMLCIKFNGWQFQGFEDAKIAVIEGIVTELIASRSLMTKAKETVKNILRRIDWLKAAKKAGGLAFTAYTGLPTEGQIKNIIDGVRDVFNDTSALATKENAEAAANLFSGLLKDSESRSVPKEIDEFRKAFAELMEKAGIERLIVLIDDLDRCLPETVIETLEAIRLFVFLPKTVFVVGADEAMIEYSVRHHFPDLPESNNSQRYARSYLEKLIQVPMRIPALGETETRIYVTLLMMGHALGEGSKEFGKLLEHGRNALRKPWEGKGININDIKTVLGSNYSEISSLVNVAEQITPILSAGTKGNPRQIKRFLNALNLRLQVAIERGFGDSIRLESLAKLMLAELFLPSSVFEHIVSSAAHANDGICKELNMLESGSLSDEDDPILIDWKTRAEVVEWAAIEPKIGAASLKPYLFVIKDRKNYFSSAAPLSPKLTILIEKLMGGQASAKTCTQDLKTLASVEVDILFNQLRSSLLGCASFKSKPAVIFGVSELVQAHPAALQVRYVEMLEELPIPKIGAWAATGHDSFITDPSAKARLEDLKRTWLSQTTDAALKAALQ